MRYALVGCGRIAANHIRAARENGLDVVALCDIREEQIKHLLDAVGCEALSSAKPYTDYRAMLRGHPELDVVAIATESGKHASIALDCIDAGKNLIIEKPIALSMTDADEIVRRAALRGVTVAVCHQNRYNAVVQCLRRAVESGSFGRLSHGSVSVRWNRSEGYYRQAPWRGTWKQDGGTLMNQCIHGIDLLLWMMGDDAAEVYGVTRNRFHGFIEGEDVGVAVVAFSSGAVGVIEGSSNVYPRNLEETFCLFGEKGTAKLGGLSVNRIEAWQVDGCVLDKEALLDEGVRNEYGNGHGLLYADVIDAIKSGRRPLVDAVAGRNALEVVLAIYKSQKTGWPIKLPLEDFSSADMAGEFV